MLEVIATGQQPAHTSLIRRDRLEAMGRDLIQLCDQLEPHGLVDYQMGIWEEEILSGEFALYSDAPLLHPNHPKTSLGPMP